MHLDGRIEPLTALAEIIGVVLLGAATGCFIFARHKFRTVDRAAQAELYRRMRATLPFEITGPSPY
jgi:hypothetical protein